MIQRKVGVAVAFTIVVVVLGWLLVSGFESNMQYYVSIKELKSQSGGWDTGLRVKGKLVTGSHIQTAGSLDHTFRISEDMVELEVRYNGLLPDTFKEGAEVLVEGAYSPQGYFTATTVMAKCPSKYEETEAYNKLTSQNDGATASGTY